MTQGTAEQGTGFKAISYDQANAILDYLTAQPYREVFKLVSVITLLPEGLVQPIVQPNIDPPIVQPMQIVPTENEQQ